MASDYSEDYLRRWSTFETAAFLGQLIPDREKRSLLFRFLARSIRLADAADSTRWGISKLARAVRLNVGPAEAVLVTSANILVMLDRVSASASGREKIVSALRQSRLTDYPSVSGSVYVQIPTDRTSILRSTLASLEVPHEEHIRRAVSRGMNGATKKGHDPLLVELIAGEAGTRLSQPAYVKVPRPSTRSAVMAPAEDSEQFTEGRPSEIVQTKYERSARARRSCLEHYGFACVVCGFDFFKVYGPDGYGLIHVHHLDPVGSGATRRTDPVADLRPVCPNRHLVIHTQTPPLGIEAVRALLNSRR